MKGKFLIVLALVMILSTCGGFYEPTAIPTRRPTENQEEVISDFPSVLEVKRIAEWEDDHESFRLYEINGVPCLTHHYRPALLRVVSGYNVTMECGSAIIEIRAKVR